jgi:hypothetical protein
VGRRTACGSTDRVWVDEPGVGRRAGWLVGTGWVDGYDEKALDFNIVLVKCGHL